MTHRIRRCLGSLQVRVRPSVTVGAGLVAAVLALALPTPARAQSIETIVTWNKALLAALLVPGGKPATVFDTRHLAVVSIAVYDAVNSFDRRYDPYVAFVDVPPGASRDAAVAQAAHDALAGVMPAQTATFDAALAASLAGIAPQAAADGAAVGAAAARAILEQRTGDGWERPFPEYIAPSLPGYYRPTPPGNLAPTFGNYPNVRGFAVSDGRRFMIEGPPALTSETYARDFNQVKSWGAVNSTVRSAEQTLISLQWAGVGTSTTLNHVWNNVLGDVAKARGLDAVETARGYALLNMTFHDALMTSMTGKYTYNLWRPIHAIREADTDGNPATEADPAWNSLLVAPPYSSAPGNMACVGASLSRSLERLFGQDNVSFSVTWTGTTGPTTTRHYNGFRELGDQQGYSRIWGGIHFLFETLSSIGQCPRLADYVSDNLLRPR